MAPEVDSTATAALARQHREIEKVLAAMSIIADDLEGWKFIDASRLADVSSFLRTFADQCQRAAEENELFPTLESKCELHTECLLPTLVEEHKKAEFLIQNLSEAAEWYISSGGARKESLITALRDLVALYRGHLWKEDNLLLSMAEKVLSQEEQALLYRAFNTQLHTGLHELADKIEQQSKQQFSHLGEVLF